MELRPTKRKVYVSAVVSLLFFILMFFLLALLNCNYGAPPKYSVDYCIVNGYYPDGNYTFSERFIDLSGRLAAPLGSGFVFYLLFYLTWSFIEEKKGSLVKKSKLGIVLLALSILSTVILTPFLFVGTALYIGSRSLYAGFNIGPGISSSSWVTPLSSIVMIFLFTWEVCVIAYLIYWKIKERSSKEA